MPFDAGKTKATKKPKTITAVDLFCGAGGTSTGLIEAARTLGYKIRLTAINHWDVAIATHQKNHEEVIHYNQAIELVDPVSVVPGKRLQLLVASPECTHHSRARGGKPRSDQKRADAWLLMRWVEDLYIENLIIENVKEFAEWGPLTAAGRPDKRHKGMYFQRFLAALRVNYTVEHKVLNCADYGDPTTRERLFILAKRGKGKKIAWPIRTHISRKELAKMALQPGLFGQEKLKPWVAAREIIDWKLEGKSIFGRKKPLSPNTLRRIYAGLMKYSLKPFIVPQFSSPETRDVDQPLGTVTTTSRGVGLAEPFLVNLKNKDRRDRSIDEPTFTQAAGGNHQAVVEPFLIKNFSGSDESRSKSLDDPLGTVVGNFNHHYLVEPFMISAGGPELEAKSVDEPMRTVLTRDHQALVEPFIVSAAHGGNTNPPRDINEPLGAVLGSPKYGVVEPFVFNMAHTGNNDETMCKDVENPLQTVAGKGMFGLVEPYLVNMKGQSNGRSVNDPTFTQTNKQHQYLAEPFVIGQQSGATPRSVGEPVPTIAGRGAVALIEPYLVKFYGSGENADDINDPLATVTSKDRFGLCIPSLGAVLDIRFRMLQPHELAAAMSFPPEYEFTGNREDKVKQIGNAVPLKTAQALCRSLLI